jgi:hypothetical protein
VRPSHGRPHGHRPIVRPSVRKRPRDNPGPRRRAHVRADAPCFTPGNFKKDATVSPSHGRPRGHRPSVRPCVRVSENVRVTTLPGTRLSRHWDVLHHRRIQRRCTPVPTPNVPYRRPGQSNPLTPAESPTHQQRRSPTHELPLLLPPLHSQHSIPLETPEDLARNPQLTCWHTNRGQPRSTVGCTESNTLKSTTPNSLEVLHASMREVSWTRTVTLVYGEVVWDSYYCCPNRIKIFYI